MRTVFINTGYACALNCLTCPVSGARANRDTTQPQLQTLLSQIGKCRNDQIYLVGGDPTLRQDLPLIIEAASMNGNYVSLYTPGVSLADRTFLLALTHAGLKHISVPIFSHIPGIHDTITQTDASLMGASEGLRNILNLRKSSCEIDVEIAITITSLNYAQLPQTVAFIAEEFKPKKVLIVQLGLSGRVADNRNILKVNLMSNMQPLLHAVEVCRGFGQEISIHGVPLCWVNRTHIGMLSPLSCSVSSVVTDVVMYGTSSERSRTSTTPRHGPCSECIMTDRCSVSCSASSCDEHDHMSAIRNQGAKR